MCKRDVMCYVHSPKADLGQCLDCLKERRKIYGLSEKGRNTMRLANRRVSERTRLIVLSHYSGGKPHCDCCGESEIKFLAIPH